MSTAFCVANTLTAAALKLASQMGIQKRKRLKDDAVPTLFVRPGAQKSLLLSEATRKRSSSSSTLADAGASKKKRAAYEKRERCRVSQFRMFFM